MFNPLNIVVKHGFGGGLDIAKMTGEIATGA